MVLHNLNLPPTRGRSLNRQAPTFTDLLSDNVIKQALTSTDSGPAQDKPARAPSPFSPFQPFRPRPEEVSNEIAMAPIKVTKVYLTAAAFTLKPIKNKSIRSDFGDGYCVWRSMCHGHDAYSDFMGHKQHKKPLRTRRDKALSTSHAVGETMQAHSQGCEEPFVLAAGVAILEQLLDRLLRILPLCGLLEGIRRDGSLQSLQLKGVPCREQMRVVHNLILPSSSHPAARRTKIIAHLDERLDLAPERHLFLAHTSCHFSWVALDSSNNSMGIGSLLGSLIQLPDHNDLLAGLTSLQHDCDLRIFQDYASNGEIRDFGVYLAGLVY